MSEVAALSIATLIPLIDTLVHLLKHKKLDVFAAFMATGFILKYCSCEAEQADFAENWNLPYVRKVMRVMTAGWGITLLGEAVIKIIMVYTLSITVYLATSHIVMYGIIGLAISWTYLYRKASRKRLQEIKNSFNPELQPR
ncbi:hypothetical protein EXW96_05045 [Paenibacillus sp. JMULE4]|uniref:hypothetical protein n=1 Tax=Paenibacillus sp. JMULE4 TaxID=2518342 RepID=UPI00157666B4|nr:hypothetical protein [Paenibacillus sp. JMULE4]NTZ16948.1 hypothetical protein [Paenibacillus sp. JMULE4]